MINKDNFEKIVEFGGMFVYEVRYFDKLSFSIISEVKTFNENYAREKCNEMIRSGLNATVVQYLVTFNN